MTVGNSVIVRARIDRRLKEEAEGVLAANGLTISDAFRLMMLRVSEDKVLPFERPTPKPMQKGKHNKDKVTAQMRHYVAFGTHDHFGFSGYRAAIACLYARSEGATQSELNEAARELGSHQSGYFNMLRQAKNKWKHDVIVWGDPTRGGKVYKLIYNPSHSAPRSVDPPPMWKEMNAPRTPPGVKPMPYRPRAGN
jgi:addiction module RelB/DinJ family antitoxin